MTYTIKPNNFLFDVTRGQDNSTMTFIVTRDLGEYKNNQYLVDMNILHDFGFDGLIKFSSEIFKVNVQLGGGMKVSLDVNKRYAWDKKEVICNQPVNYYCSKGWIGSAIAFIKEHIALN
jgi:hypothetical protein